MITDRMAEQMYSDYKGNDKTIKKESAKIQEKGGKGTSLIQNNAEQIEKTKTETSKEAKKQNRVESSYRPKSLVEPTYQDVALRSIERKVEKMRKKTNLSGNKLKRRKVNLTKHMIRLADATTVNQVNGVIRLARSELRFMRMLGVEEAVIEKAKIAVNKLTNKGRIKIGRLKKEEQLVWQRQQAEKQNHLEEARILREELRKRKLYRKMEEQKDIIEAMEWDRKTNAELEALDGTSDIQKMSSLPIQTDFRMGMEIPSNMMGIGEINIIV